MARQTRSSNAASASSPTTTKATSTPSKSTRGTGKRKRASLADTEQQQPALKQRRSESSSVRASVEAQTPKGKEEDLDEALTTENEDNDMDNEDADEEEGTTGVKHEDEAKEVEQKSVGDLPLYEKDASMLLDVLEMMDSQGLLDRVFPLPTSSPSNPQSISLRTALQDSQTYPIRIIRAAITHLLPLHTHPRSRPSAASTQQLRFCQQALQLLDTASKRVCPIPPLSALSPDSNTDSTSKSKSERAPPQYALLQRLPTGEWWTSLAHTSTAALKGKTGHAELVSIVPTPSAPVASSSTIPNTSDSDLTAKLKSLTLRTTPRRPVIAMTWPRRLSAGTFTTYNASHGPYASFAPSYDSGGAELGRNALGLLAWDQSRRREMRSVAVARLRERLQASMHTEQETASIQTSEESMQVDTRPSASDAATVEDQVDATTALSGLLPDSEIEGVQSIVDQLGKEEIIADLLHRNARALDRLQGLQLARLAGPNGGLSEPEVGSEEWETAQTITETLALLTSLRPRLGVSVTPIHSSIPSEQDSQASADSDDKPLGALTPTPASLHALQRSLPTTAQPGWRGTLPPSKPKALRDDRTMLVRPPPAPIPAPPAASVNPASVPLPSSRTPSVPGTPGIGGRAGSVGVPPQQLPHPQASVQQQYVQPQPTAQGAYPYAAYTQYATNGYTYPAHLQMTAPTQPTTPASAPGQQGYANYGYAAQAATYASYWAAQQAQGGMYGQPQQPQAVIPPAQAQGQGQRPPAVVANTVQAQGQGWGQGQAQAQQVQGKPVPVLPPHLLSAGSTSTPGTPVSVGR